MNKFVKNHWLIEEKCLTIEEFSEFVVLDCPLVKYSKEVTIFPELSSL